VVLVLVVLVLVLVVLVVLVVLLLLPELQSKLVERALLVRTAVNHSCWKDHLLSRNLFPFLNGVPRGQLTSEERSGWPPSASWISSECECRMR
jgi:hypothetical protein